jgi:hypothetical protein
MRLTQRGKQVIALAVTTIAGGLFFSGFVVAKALGEAPPIIKVVEAQPVLILQSSVEKQLKIKDPSDKLEKYRNKVKLSHLECKGLLKEVGFKGKALEQAWAIVMRESNCRSHAYNGNENTGDNSYGIFQINMIKEIGDSRREKFGMVSNAMLLDPVTNAQIAHYMSKGGTDWSAWKGMTPRAKEWLKKFPK